MNTSESLREHLAAVVEGSDDGIITKNLDGIIQSWNRGAEVLFGYAAEEAIGQPITMLIPEGRLNEEVDIIARLKRGERIRHFETMRQRKDGSLVPISLTISPVRNGAGEVIGASKIARDITLQHQAREQERALLAEMRHRVGNCFALASGLLSVFGRQAQTPQELVSMMRDRLQALAKAHMLAVSDPDAVEGSSGVTLPELVEAIVAPFAGVVTPVFGLEDLPLRQAAISPLSMVVYELATDSVKYGCLSPLGGALEVASRRDGERLLLTWKESCPLGEVDEHRDGFGTRLIRSTLAGYFDGTLTRSFRPDGMTAELDLALEGLRDRAEPATDRAKAAE